MSKLDNLKPFTSNQSHDEAVKNGSKGGEKSGETRRRKKKAKDYLQTLLDMQATGSNKEVMQAMGIDEEDQTNEMLLTIGIFQKAVKGDIQAYNTIVSMLGETPISPTDKARIKNERDKLKIERQKLDLENNRNTDDDQPIIYNDLPMEYLEDEEKEDS